jgi:hypothetical protein
MAEDEEVKELAGKLDDLDGMSCKAERMPSA